MKIISLHSAPRSGSTWLQTIFESHPNIKTIYQPLFSYQFKNYLTEYSTKQDFTNFINKIIHTKDLFCNMNTDFHTNKNNIDIPRYPKSIINNILIKNVHHHYLIEYFIKWCPNIKIIGLIRHPCAVIYSQLNCQKEKDSDWLNGSTKNINKENYFGYNKWKEIYNLFYYIKKKYPNNIIIIKYDAN